MTTGEVAKELVALCKQGKFEEAVNALYGQTIVSLEAMDMNGQSREAKGIAAVRKKSEWWIENHEVHSVAVDGPFVALDKFAVVFGLDVTFKPTGKRKSMTEVGVYTVRDGKIVHEEFLYKM